MLDASALQHKLDLDRHMRDVFDVLPTGRAIARLDSTELDQELGPLRVPDPPMPTATAAHSPRRTGPHAVGTRRIAYSRRGPPGRGACTGDIFFAITSRSTATYARAAWPGLLGHEAVVRLPGRLRLRRRAEQRKERCSSGPGYVAHSGRLEAADRDGRDRHRSPGREA